MIGHGGQVTVRVAAGAALAGARRRPFGRAAGSQRDLEDSQINEVRPPLEIAAEPMRHQHAEITALTFIIEIQGWKPLALGIGPKTRVICDKLEDDASEERKAAGPCEAFIEVRGGQILQSRQEAVWP